MENLTQEKDIGDLEARIAELGDAAQEATLRAKELRRQKFAAQKELEQATRTVPLERKDPMIQLYLFDWAQGRAWTIGRGLHDQRPALESLSVPHRIGKSPVEAAYEAIEVRGEPVRLILPKNGIIHWAVEEGSEIRLICHSCHEQGSIRGACNLSTCGNYEAESLLRRRRS